MQQFLNQWHEAAMTSTGFFWTALWAFALGYLISRLIQVLVTRQRMQQAMGESGPKSMLLGTFFGFISSSCSFAALSTTRALFQKGAGLAPAMAFMLASTNLVIELGIVITVFLSWHFVVGEYIGGILLILVMWLLIRLTKPQGLIDAAREKLSDGDHNESKNAESWREKIGSLKGWQQIGQKYVMEWRMVWKDVLIGFTVAGLIFAFVPDRFFQTLFIGSGGEQSSNPGFFSVLAQTLIGPIAAFFTFIGSMGNIPLAALLYDHGVSFAGIMAFIFSDLVVLPVLRINASYYGWKMSFYILGLLLTSLVVVSLTLHYGFLGLNLLPEPGAHSSIVERDHFKLNYGFVLNVIFLCISAAMVWLWRINKCHHKRHDHGSGKKPLSKRIVTGLACCAVVWLAGGLLLPLFGSFA